MSVVKVTKERGRSGSETTNTVTLMNALSLALDVSASDMARIPYRERTPTRRGGGIERNPEPRPCAVHVPENVGLSNIFQDFSAKVKLSFSDMAKEQDTDGCLESS